MIMKMAMKVDIEKLALIIMLNKRAIMPNTDAKRAPVSFKVTL